MKAKTIETPKVPIEEDHDQWLWWAVNEGAFLYYDDAVYFWNATMDIYPKQEWRWRWIIGVGERLKLLQDRYDPTPQKPTLAEALTTLVKRTTSEPTP